ncbi:metal ABC transporter substrate-binding protein [Bartonella sp. WD16.2]|uniref:metal ABC transporter substrate-binding protein n=1 Tax=Bartonella sp. WD16.2 TaxID=1933904 RepID=UPI00099A7B5A|nr:metal ABC transporter substrate-binding protein [Bartonella sp. WD16.2]AQX20637.1 manganese/iron transport system substrate-binding protein [Bartonella sp. WD16.2]
MKVKAFFTAFFLGLILLIPNLALSANKFKAVTTFTIIADMARNVAGNVADVESITKPGAEIHEYQPTPRDLMRAQGANLILWNGLELELWFEKFFQNIKNVPSVVVSEGVVPIAIGEGPFSGKPNPHAWMSPTLALIYIDNIRDAFVKYDPEHASIYKENAEIYKQKIRLSLDPIKAELEALSEDKRWLVTSEGAFSYLARDFGLKELYLWPINADQQGTPQQVKHVIDMVRKYHIQVIFSESTISAAPAKQVAKETGIRYGGVLYVDSLSEKSGEVPTYIDLLRVTSTRIAQGLSDGVKGQ